MRSVEGKRQRAVSKAGAVLVPALALVLAAGGAAAQQAASQQAVAEPHGGPETHELYYGAVLVDQAEFRSNGRGNGTYAFEGLTYYGTDYNKVQLNLRAESTEAARRLESAELQVLYSRLVGYYWDLQFGVRHDFCIEAEDGTPGRTYGVVGLQGLAPGYFEVNVHAFLGERGVPLLRAEASYDLLITNRLVLQPEVEVDLAAARDEEALISPGLYRMEAGLRLRYEITREFAPYVGVSHERAVGGAAGLTRRSDEKPEALAVVAGVRLYF
jgi:copper resistance protein B